MTRVLHALTACIAIAAAGCFNPALDGFACGPAGECPQGYECSMDNQCVLPGEPPGPDIDAAPPDPNDREPPQASIVFPLPAGMTEESTITVRGTASDTSMIRTVSVNGRMASTQNDFQDWTAEVSLAPGMNVIDVATEDAQGNQATDQASVTVERISPLIPDPHGMAVTPDGATALVFDQATQAIIAIDVATGERSVVTSPALGEGPVLIDVTALAMLPNGQEVLALDVAEAAVRAVDLETGNRRPISGFDRGNGDAFDSLVGLTVHTNGTKAYVGDDLKNVLFEVDLATGNRTVVSGTNDSGQTIGAGDPFETITAIAYDEANNGVLVLDGGRSALLGVDISQEPGGQDGERHLLADDALGTGPDFVDPVAVVPSAQSNITFVFDRGLNALLRVNEDNGNRFAVSGQGQGSGVRTSDVESIAFHPDLTRLFVTDDDYVVPLVIDVATGARTPLVALNVGSGTSISDPEGLALDPTGERLVVADDGLNGLAVIDLATGDRTLIRDQVNEMLGDPQVVAFHPDGRLVVMNSVDNQCVAVKIDTGEIALISSNDSEGPNWDTPEAMTLLNESTALVADYSPRLVSMDLDTGARTLISDNANQPGIDLDDPVSMILDEARNRVLLVDTGAEALIAIDLATGARSELAGAGPELGFPEGITHGAAPDTAVVYDADAQAYVLLDLATGTRSPLFEAKLRDGMPLSSPYVMVVDRARQVLFTADFVITGVVAIDMVTGARLIVSR